MRCKVCNIQFKVKYFLEKTCSDQCKKEYETISTKQPIRKESPTRTAEKKVYQIVRKAYLLKNPNCECCSTPTREIHHTAGRIGSRYIDDKTFMNVCRPCHNWIHSNPKEARKKGWLK